MQNHKSKIKMATDNAKQVTAILVFVLSVAGVSFARYSGGTGEPNNPYRIATANDLNDIGNHVEDYNKCFVMLTDINMRDYSYTSAPIAPDISASGGFQGTAFPGSFDGNGHIISNLTIDTAGADNRYVGLFGKIGAADENAEIKNLSLAEPNVDAGTSWYVGSLAGMLARSMISGCTVVAGNVCGGYSVGGLVGSSEDGVICDCHATCDVSGANLYAGGLAGIMGHGGEIFNCCASGDVCGYDHVGGLVGWLTDLDHRITDCHATGNVDGMSGVGGLIGVIDEGGIVKRCYATGTVKGYSRAGGLLGHVERGDSLWISNCYAAGDVSGDGGIGGLAGWLETELLDFEILNCYATGAVDGNSNVGGLVGHRVSSVVIEASFWDVETSGQSEGVGFGPSSGTTGETTANMQRESTFTDAGWDFVEVWDIGEGQTYPFLQVYPTGDIDHDNKVDWFDFAILAGHWLEAVEQ